MVYDVYKFLVENEATILQDLSMLKYIKADLAGCVSNYLESLIRDNMSDATAEEQKQVLQDALIVRFQGDILLSLERMLYGDKNSLH